ncbi:MAG: hypothetical protein ACK53H_03875 [Betaproteobacteria bacterium]|jgi:hypothetical protein
MMTRIRMRIASILRRIANQLDPYDPESLSFVARPLRGGGPGRPKDKEV